METLALIAVILSTIGLVICTLHLRHKCAQKEKEPYLVVTIVGSMFWTLTVPLAILWVVKTLFVPEMVYTWNAWLGIMFMLNVWTASRATARWRELTS